MEFVFLTWNIIRDLPTNNILILLCKKFDAHVSFYTYLWSCNSRGISSLTFRLRWKLVIDADKLFIGVSIYSWRDIFLFDDNLSYVLDNELIIHIFSMYNICIKIECTFSTTKTVISTTKKRNRLLIEGFFPKLHILHILHCHSIVI